MAFKFRLEMLLSLRKRRQELAEAELSRVLGRLSDCREAMDILKQRLANARQMLASGVEQGVLASDYAWQSQHISALEARLQEFRSEETKLEMEAARVRHQLKVAHRERELVEKFKERDFRAWRHEMQRQEQNQADDLSTIRYIRQNR